MYKRLLLSGLALTTLASYGTESAAPAKDKPNIIMFLVDDMGWQDTSVPFYNNQTSNLNTRFQTPNMERLARMGGEIYGSLCLRHIFSNPMQSDVRNECFASQSNELDPGTQPANRCYKRCHISAFMEL